MEIPDHTPSRALPLQSLIGLFSGATDYLLPDLLQFSFSRGVRQHMKHSFEKRNGERSLTKYILGTAEGFEITGIVISSGCDKSFSCIF